MPAVYLPAPHSIIFSKQTQAQTVQVPQQTISSRLQRAVLWLTAQMYPYLLLLIPSHLPVHIPSDYVRTKLTPLLQAPYPNRMKPTTAARGQT